MAHRDVAKYYEKSDLTLLPYQPEIPTASSMSPIKLFEAMASGRPIIASDLPVIREILTDRQTALLINPKEPRQWVEAIRLLQKDRNLALELAKNAKQVSAQYSWKARAANIARSLNII